MCAELAKIYFPSFLENASSSDASLERFLQENEFDIISFILRWLLKKIQGPPEVKPYHLYLGNKSKFCENYDLYVLSVFDCCLPWLRKFWAIRHRWHTQHVNGTTLKFQMIKWVLWYIIVKINKLMGPAYTQDCIYMYMYIVCILMINNVYRFHIWDYWRKFRKIATSHWKPSLFPYNWLQMIKKRA